MTGYTFITDTPTLLDDAATSSIHVAQIGRWKDPRYGSFGISASDVANWKRLLDTYFQGRIPIDIDHRTDKGVSSEAAGWITGLEQRGTDVIAQVEWNSLGQEVIGDKRYLYISPTFQDQLTDKHGKKLGPALLRAALTNNPFLRDMPAVSLSAVALDAPYPIAPGDPVAESTGDLSLGRRGVCRALGIDDFDGAITHTVQWEDGTTSEGHRGFSLRNLKQLAAAIPEAPDSPPVMPEFTKIAKALSLAEDATEDQILQAIGDKNQPAKTLDAMVAESGKVLLSKDEHARLLAGADAVKALHDRDFADAVKLARDEGRLDAVPENEARLRKLYDADPATTLEHIAALPKLPITLDKDETRETKQTDGEIDAPDGVDPQRFQLAAKAKAYMADHPDVDYLTALEKVA